MPILAIMLYRRDQIDGFRDTMLAVVMPLLLGFIGYVAVTALDPAFTMRDRFSVSLLGSPVTKRLLTSTKSARWPFPAIAFPACTRQSRW